MKNGYSKAEEITIKYQELDATFTKDLSDKYQLDDIGLYKRLLRAVGNQVTEGPATVSRYSLFINQIVRYIDIANDIINADQKEDASRILNRSRNALAAFSEIQMQVFDTIFKDIK